MTALPIQPYDIVMLAVLAMATLFGLWKGMAWQIASVASVAVSFVVAARMSGVVAPMIRAQEPWNRFIAMLLLYLATSAGIWLAFRLVAGILDRVRLKEFDRQVGALFGFAKGALLCVVITFFAVTLSESLRQNVLNTYSGRTIAAVIKRTSPIMPAEVLKVLGSYIDELDRKLAPEGPTEASPAPAAPRAPQRPAPRITAEIGNLPEPPAASSAPVWRPESAADPTPATESVPRFVPAPQADPAPHFEDRDQDSSIPLFPVKNSARDRT